MKADKYIGWFTLFVAGWLAGAWITPEPKFAACIEVPRKVQKMPVTKAEKAVFVQRYSNGGM